MYVRLVQLWGARAKHAVIMRLPSSRLPQRAAYFSAGITPGYRSGPPPEHRGAVLALLKTRNQLMPFRLMFQEVRPIRKTRNQLNYNCSVVHFSQGCNTGWHTHDCDQLLIVTSGAGYVATEQEQREIHVGDVVQIKAGERHWHGAKADTTMAHITITTVGSQATWG
jgi:quercetin dioxygenase-like cupin family protein